MDEEQDRSERPTPFKLSRAREKGSVARGMDLGFLTGLAAFFGWASVEGGALVAGITQATQRSITLGPQLVADPQAVATLTGIMFAGVLRPLAIMAGAIFLVVLACEMLQTGVVFSATPLKPDFSRLNPAKGLKRLFTIRLLVETAKNIFKLALYGFIAWLVGKHLFFAALGTLTDAGQLANSLERALMRMLAAFALAAILFAVLDQLIVRRDFFKKMRMSRREVKREHRDREGDPRMKQRRRKLHGDFVKLAQSLRGVRGADVLIVNPVHYAVALRYDPRHMAAPQVVSLGSHGVARRLRGLAFAYGVPIVEDPPLARALYRSCVLEREVPATHFQRVADIYLALRKSKPPLADPIAHV